MFFPRKECKARQVLYIEWKVNAQRLKANLTVASLFSNPTKKIKDGHKIKLKCHLFRSDKKLICRSSERNSNRTKTKNNFPSLFPRHLIISSMQKKRLTQILMDGPQATHSQYRFGEKHNALMMSLWSNVCKCLPSFKSHNRALASLPPDVHNEPSGDTVTVFKYPLCPLWLILSLQLVKFQTLTVRSQPHDTMMGLL